jgi:hypothetical protein
MIFFQRQTKKPTDFEHRVIERLDVLEYDKARLRQDIRAIFREEIKQTVHDEVLRALSDYQKRGWRQIA